MICGFTLTMPQRAKRPCKRTGCAALVDSGFCDEHKGYDHKADRLYRGSAASRGYDRQWQKVRLEALKRDYYICQDCIRLARVTPAEDVHHVLKVSLHPLLRLVLSNLISLCKPCHAVRTAAGE